MHQSIFPARYCTSYFTVWAAFLALQALAHAQMQATPSVLLPGNYYDATRKPLGVNDQAPDFTLPLVEGSPTDVPLRLSLYVGSRQNGKPPVTLLIFWAFWCDTWKDVTHHLQLLRPGLQDAHAQVVCVAVDASQQRGGRRAMAAGRLWFPIGIDRHSEVTARYGVRRVPTLFVLDSTGRIRTRFEGVPTDHRLMEAIHAARRAR